MFQKKGGMKKERGADTLFHIKHPVSCTNNHRDVTDLVNQDMVKNTKT